MLSFIVTWPLKVAVNTLRCHLLLNVFVLFLRPNDGRKPN